MKCFLYIIPLLLVGCENNAELNARDFVWKIFPAVPIKSINCDSIDHDGDRRVDCLVQTESMGRIFKHKLKCYNSNNISTLPRERCIEALDE